MHGDVRRAITHARGEARYTERLVDDLLLLDRVHLRRTRRRRRHRPPRNPLDAGQLVRQHLGQRQPERRPRALVGRLLLHPEVLLGVRVLVQRLGQPPLRQRRELLDAHDRHVVAVVLGLARGQLVVDLAAGQQDPLDLAAVAVAVGVGGLLDHRPELLLGEVADVADRGLVAQHRLRREHDQRPVDAVQRVPAQQVEVVRRRRRHRDRHRALGPQQQEPLDAARRVVGPLALVAVRQQQHHVGELAPLGLAGADELVDDRLRAVDEVAELGLPQHQCVRVADRVAVLEAHRGELRQRRVVHHELAAGRRAVGVGGQQLQRRELLRRSCGR